MKVTINLILLFISINSFCQKINFDKKDNQKKIITEHLTNAYKNSIISKDFQDCLDIGLKKDSTIAYLWQQKAMAYFKVRKYEVGMKYINKAVKYDAKSWQPYRAFIKCIFAKSYKTAISDFQNCIKKFGNGYEMDHTYGFYIGISYLQLNEYKLAEKFLKEYNEDIFKNRQGLEHPTALFYYGISKYEQQKWKEAILEFDKALKIYPNFSDVKFYKSICLTKIGLDLESKSLLEEAKKDGFDGFTINEDNVLYEKYPYQIKWH